MNPTLDVLVATAQAQELRRIDRRSADRLWLWRLPRGKKR
jgi:hypothetical protein